MSKEKPPFSKETLKKRRFYNGVGVQFLWLAFQKRMLSVMFAQE